MPQPRQYPLEPVPGPLVALAVGAAYFAIAQYVIWLNDPVNAGAGYWPAAGVTLVALLLLPTRRWPWVVAAVVAAETAGSLVHDYPFTAYAWWCAGNALEPLVAAFLLRRFSRDGRLTPLRDLYWFLGAGVLLAPFVGALIGSVGTATAYDRSWPGVFLKWWVGDGLGVLVVAPLLLCFREPAGPRRARWEGIALAVVALTLPLLAFRRWQPEYDVVLPYLFFPVVFWASVRFGIRGAAFVGFAVAELSNIATALEAGPFHLAAGRDDQMVAVLQVFLGSALTAGLLAAAYVGDVLARTRIFERQRSVAEALQTAVLPDRLPAVPGVELAARYVPASSDATLQVGGDWYDAFELRDGSTALVIGDVAGHDLAAAVVMGQLRNGLRSLFLDTGDPAYALASLDRELADNPDGSFATAICARYLDGTLTWANAGHPPPLVVDAQGAVHYLDAAPQPMLGVGLGGYVTHEATIRIDDTVVAFTDGLVEHRTWSLDEAFVHLAGLAGASPRRGPELLCDLLLEKGLDGRRREDDACVLVLRRTR